VFLFSRIINYTKKSLKPHGLSDFSFKGVFLQPLFLMEENIMKFLLNLLAGMALATTTECSKKCIWMAYQEELPVEFYSFQADK
jgi:hypothetical protein